MKIASCMLTQQLGEESLEELKRHAKEIDERAGHDGIVVALADQATKGDAFLTGSGSGSPKKHHYGDYGLIVHTREVVTTCLAVRAMYPQYNIDEAELFLAALYHDTGKAYDYEKVEEFVSRGGEKRAFWQDAKHKRYIHHVSRSAIIWSRALDRVVLPKHSRKAAGFYDRYGDAVLHAILAHHGRREWGSPVAPKSRVAWLLHLCDGISARMYDADTMDIVPGG